MQNPSKVLGLKQSEMAMLLGVTISQYAMFEIGQRSLPTNASVLLSEMLAHVHQEHAASKSTALRQKQQSAISLAIEKMLRENQYRQLLTTKKIELAQKKQEAELRRLRLAGFFDQRENSRKLQIASVPDMLQSRANQLEKGESAIKLFELEMKMALLKHEELLLNRKLRGIKGE